MKSKLTRKATAAGMALVLALGMTPTAAFAAGGGSLQGPELASGAIAPSFGSALGAQELPEGIGLDDLDVVDKYQASDNNQDVKVRYYEQDEWDNE